MTCGRGGGPAGSRSHSASTHSPYVRVTRRRMINNAGHSHAELNKETYPEHSLPCFSLRNLFQDAFLRSSWHNYVVSPDGASPNFVRFDRRKRVDEASFADLTDQVVARCGRMLGELVAGLEDHFAGHAGRDGQSDGPCRRRRWRRGSMAVESYVLGDCLFQPTEDREMRLTSADPML